MSDGFRERFQGSAEYEVWQYIAEHPGLTSRAIVHGVTTRREESVHRALRSLRVKGVLHNAGEQRDHQAWYLSQWGEECLRNGLIVSRGKHGEDPKVEAGERNWEPKPWVHPIRARALGIPAASDRRVTVASCSDEPPPAPASAPARRP